jgi:hypothetical protein
LTEAAVDFPPLPLRHLIVVAGARGAGKTTFLWDLAKRRLPPEVRRLLPLKAALWPQADASDFGVWLPMIATDSGKGARIENLVLHYDLVNYYAGLHTEALAVLGEADRLTGVTIAPTLDRLAVQYASRTAGFRDAVLAEGHLPARARNHVARALVTYPPQRADIPRALKHIDNARMNVLTRYSEAGWLDALHRRWEAEIRRRFRGTAIAMVVVEPGDPAAKREPRWRLRPTI